LVNVVVKCYIPQVEQVAIVNLLLVKSHEISKILVNQSNLLKVKSTGFTGLEIEIIHLWLDLTKAGFHTHNGNVNFSPPLDFYINKLTIHVCIIANCSLVCFSSGLFLWPIWCARVVFKWQWFGWTGTHPVVNGHTTGQKFGHQIGYYFWYLELK